MMRSKGFVYRSSTLNRLMMILTIFSLVFGNQSGISVTPVLAQSTSSAPTVAAPVSSLALHVISAADSTNVTTNYGIHKGDAITQFKYIINIDNTGSTEQRSAAPGSGCSPQDAGYPGTCNWLSVAGAKSNAPIYTQGNQDDFPGGVFTINGLAVDLPAGRYLISVLADNYKIDGAHFTVPGSGDVTVEMQPYDLPTATIQTEVFEDNAPTNSAPDVPAERGIAGFEGHIKDYLDEVTTDIFGDPLCGDGHCVSKCYVVDGGVDTGTVAPIDAAGLCPFREELPANATTIDTLVPISATAVIEGKIKIPNLGPNRYALAVVPPNQSGWAQTTTLEGNHDWDAWVMEGATGLDTEFVVAGEPFPAISFGYIRETNSMGAGTGEIKGSALAVSAYIPPVGGIGGEAGLLGAKPKDKNPIKSFYVSVSDLNNNDKTVFMKHFDCTVTSGGCPFSITGVPDGDYVLGIWDEPQDYIFGEQNVSIVNGEVADIGAYSMLGWWTSVEGHVFNDLNGNGKMDADEKGIPNFVINMKTRENSVMDRGTVSVTTDANGYYWMESAYPITQWLVEEAFIEGFQTTGITYQADNQPNETTVIGAGVDVNLHPVIGLGGRLDWGVKAYDPGTNGGIVGSITYDTTRNETDAAKSLTENWQPGVAGLNVDLFAPVACVIDPLTGAPDPNVIQVCDPTYSYQLDVNGAYKTGQLLNQYVSETWQRPTGCVARNVDGVPLQHDVDEQVLPLDPNAPCLEAPLMSVQFGPMEDSQGTPNANFGATVDGNYGFGDGCFGPGGFDTTAGACADGTEPTALPSNTDYIVKVEIPNDSFGRPLYQVTKEEDVNIFTGDSFIPQNIPSVCAGPLHTVDVAGVGTDYYSANIAFIPGVEVPASNPIENPNFAADGPSPFEGQPMPLCDAKLVHVADRRSIAPGFNLFTDVPLPGRFWGLIVDDLNFSSNPKSTAYGEKLPLSFAPIGVYDYTNRLLTTVESDYNGLWDVLMPSTNRISCPTPSGVCANLYRFVGNDAGTPGHWNANYDPQYRTIAAEFEAFPGLTVPADLAPTPVAVAVQIPGSQTITSIACYLNDPTGAIAVSNPEFFAINKPYMRTNDSGAARTFTISGLGFGAASGSVMLDTFNMTIASWSDRQIQFTVPANGGNAPSAGPHQLKITTAFGSKSTVNALTFHVLNPVNSNGAYNPRVFEVGVGKTFDPTSAASNAGDPANGIGNYEHALQDALNAAAAFPKALVVVYPGPVDNGNPRYNGRGAYYENLVIHSPVKLQGVGPGGVYPTNLGLAPVQGSIIDGIAFGGDSNLAEAWRVLVNGLTRAGNQDVSEGEVMYVLPSSTTQFNGAHNNNFDASIDGFNIRGGDQMGFPGNLNAIFGGFPGPAAGLNVETQGGAIFANSYASYLGITNNIVQNNGGTYGAIRVGTPNIATSDNRNDHVRIAFNRIIANGGTNLAGAIGLFGGSDNYVVANNDVCGNFSAEYGGGISHFGKSNGGSIHDNRIYYNHSYDEGAGIMIAGELATVPTANYGQPGGAQGSGPVDIYNNLIQANMSEDDGGGLRFLMAGNFPMNVFNNMIVNNVSTHEGGGVALDDAPNVRFYNNTVMNNKTTATALTSDGKPAPAGLSTGSNSDQLQATLPAGSPLFSNPLIFNDIFYNNWAGTKGTNTVTGMTPTDADSWDMGVLGTAFSLSPTNSILQTTGHPGVIASPTNKFADPAVASTLDIPLSFTSWRTNVNFTGAIMVSADLPPQLLSDYHLSGSSSPAYNMGAASKTVPTYQRAPNTLPAPAFDIDNQVRPALGGFDAGADEFPGLITNLSVTKTDGLTTVQPGNVVHYTITVSNAGPDAATLATLTDNVPASLTGVTWSCAVPASAGYACGAPNGAGSINTTVNLPTGGSATFTLNGTVAANATGTLANTATVAAAAGTSDPNASNNSATDSDTVVLPADLSITKTDGLTTVNRGGAVRYTIVVSNAGPNAVTGAVVNDNFPNQLNGTINWTCATTGGASCGGNASGSGTINRTVNLPVGSTVTFTTTSGSVSNNTLATTLVNTATVTEPAGIIDANQANNSATDTDTINGVHVGDLNWTSGNTSATQWSATVTITVHDANHNPVSGVVVTGAWPISNLGQCTTNAAGQCAITRNSLSRSNTSSVTFAVLGLSHNPDGYQISLNHDPDSGAQASNGTTITVSRPAATGLLIDPPPSGNSVLFMPVITR